MLQVRGLVLYFFLLILGVFFNLTPDGIHKRGRFFKIFLEKGLKFIPYEGVSLVLFSLSLMLLPAEVDPLLEEWGRKRYVFVALNINRFEMVLALPAEVVALYVRALIV